MNAPEANRDVPMESIEVGQKGYPNPSISIPKKHTTDALYLSAKAALVPVGHGTRRITFTQAKLIKNGAEKDYSDTYQAPYYFNQAQISNAVIEKHLPLLRGVGTVFYTLAGLDSVSFTPRENIYFAPIEESDNPTIPLLERNILKEVNYEFVR